MESANNFENKSGKKNIRNMKITYNYNYIDKDYAPIKFGSFCDKENLYNFILFITIIFFGIMGSVVWYFNVH